MLIPLIETSIKHIRSNNLPPEKPVTGIIVNGLFILDNKWVVTYWNNGAERLLKVTANDIVGKNLWEEFAGIIPVIFYTVYDKAFVQDAPVHFKEYWAEMGAWFDVIVCHCDETLFVSFKPSGQGLQLAGCQQELKELHELYKFVTLVTNDCLWEWHFQTREIFWIDGGHKNIFGYQIENALIPQSFWEACLHPEDKERVLGRFNRIIAEGVDCIWQEEYRFKRSDGEYAFVRDRGYIIWGSNKNAARMIGATQDITEQVLLERQLAAGKFEKQREITEAVLTALENDRKQIGSELHDNLNQILVAAKMYVQMAKKNEKNRDIYLDKSCGYLADVIEEIRKLSKTLVIPGTHIIGLFDNIKNLVHDMAAVNPLKIEFRVKGVAEEEINDKLQLTIFRIVQEQVNNILKHAEADKASISISHLENHIELLIADNGKGFDLSDRKSGVGIINIKSRAEVCHGNVWIMSEPGKGYELKVVLPLNQQVITEVSTNGL